MGSYTKCWRIWRYENVTPSYDKFYYVTEGEFYLNINDHEFIAKKGQLFFLPFNSTQSYYHISDNTATKYWFHAIYKCNEMDISQLLNLPYYIEVPQKDHNYITGLFKKILNEEVAIPIADKLEQKAAMLELLAYYIQRASANPESHLTEKRLVRDAQLREIIQYIEDHLSEDITVQELCQIPHFHPNYFIRYFKAGIGCPPRDYINKRRMERAKQLLQNEKISIQDVARITGFKSSYYFSRLFKQKTGFTPTDYRLISHAKPTSEEK